MKFSKPSPKRQGVILLVVISLLVLFSLVGIAFVIYAESQANTARIWREGESFTRPDADPELLLAYFLGQLIYDTNDPKSALQGQSLASNMYGPPGSTIPFQKVPYTYPDSNNLFLAAQKAGFFVTPPLGVAGVAGTDGAVLIPSFYRNSPQPGGAPLTLRAAGLPPMPPGGDVKNLADSPGTYIPGTNPPQFAGNDSIWMDVGFPVMKSPDGRKFKPLFAPLILSLDNRINANIHGNVRGSTSGKVDGSDPNNGLSLSDQGWGPWEVNPRWVLQNPTDPNEARRLLIGNSALGIQGRYDLNFWGNPAVPFALQSQYASKGHFYNATNFDGSPPGSRGMFLPGAAQPAPQGPVAPTSAFPWFSGIYDNGDPNTAGRNHPLLYSPFMPRQGYYMQGANDNSFPVSSVEALLRYRDKGSPSLSSPFFRCCPLSFGDPTNGGKARRLMTPLSMDVDQPAVIPWMTPPPPVGGQGTYSISTAAGGLSPSTPYPTGPPLPSQPQGTVSAAPQGRVNLNRPLPDYPAVVNGQFNDPGFTGFQAARQARQALANDIFLVLQTVSGANSPATTPPGTPEYNALRWLAQLAVNIVDFTTNDDYSTPFNWNASNQNLPNGDWVYGTKLPRLVVNEVYCEVQNAQGDTTGKAKKPYQVKFWVELLNPLYSGASGVPNQSQLSPVLLSEDSAARLWVPAGSNGQPAYAAYKVTLTTKNQNLRNPANTRGDPDGPAGQPTAPTIPPNTPPAATSTVQSEVATYNFDTSGGKAVLMGIDPNVVLPSNGQPSGPDASNAGYYVLGPKDDFPGTAPPPNPNATMRIQDPQANAQPPQPGQPTQPLGGMVCNLANNTNDPLAGMQAQLPPKYTVLLRRLCCPAMQPDPNPASPTYNPYISVDYMEDVQPWDALTVDTQGKHTPSMTQQPPRCSVGRNQPYAADSSQRSPQVPTPPPPPQQPAPSQQPIQHTFFKSNQQGTAQPVPFDWLVFANRPLISPMELLQVSLYKPHELTQMFMTGGMNPNAPGVPNQKFTHRAVVVPGAPQGTPPYLVSPWLDSSARLYRALEFLSANSPIQWVPTGGRTMGKININDVWDIETFLAVADPVANNFFTPADVQTIFGNMLRSRSPQGYPGAGDRPFRGMAAPYEPPGDPQGGVGVEDTFLRADLTDPAPNPPPNPAPTAVQTLALKRRLFELPNPPPEANGHPYIKYELMRKVFNNFTTRSNVFAVYLTVGFFEVLDETTQPPTLGAELGQIANEHVRHRMFAIIDRTNLTVDFNKRIGPPAPNIGAPGQRPFFINSLTAVSAPGTTTITVPGFAAGTYEGNPWSISLLNTPFLVVDTGSNQEIVQLTQAPAAGQLTLNFTKPHAAGFAISNAVLGNPGPQPRFDMRNPSYSGVVRMFTIVE